MRRSADDLLARDLDMAIPYHALLRLLLYSPVFAKAPDGNEARLIQLLLDALSPRRREPEGIGG